MRTIGPAGTFLILLGVLAAVPVQAQTPPGICDRTQQVQDGILNWLSGVSDCAEVTTTHLTTVTELTLESVGLTSLRADDFAGLTELKELRLTGNKQLLALPSGVFSGLAKLETLDLYNNQFYQGLPAGVFSGLSALETLNLGANRITALRAEAFSGLSALETLNLGNNRITALPAGVFSGLSALETLSLSDILITALPAGVFSGLSALEMLNLGGNDLTEVPVEVFSDISALKMLILRWNQIGSVPDAAFSDLPNLEKLDLFSNLITALPSGAFSGLTKLKVLKAGSNQLVALPDGVFSGLTMLDTLDVAENPVHPLLLTVTVEMVGSDRVRAKVPAGAPFALSLPVSVTNGGLAGGASTLEITAGAVAGEAVAVTRTEGTTEAVTVDLGTPLPSPPMGTQPPYRHRGYAFVRAPSGLPVKFVSPAWVRNVRVVSGPGSDGVWSAGERVELEVRYTLPVVVEQPSSYYDCWSYNDDGTCRPPGPFVAVAFRSDARPGYGKVLSTPLVPYVGGSGTDTPRFAYTVGAAEDGARGVVVADNGMLLRGATIRTLEGGDAASRYTITRVMQVDVRTPSGAAWTAGETVRVTVRFAGPTSYTPPEEPVNWDKVEVDETGGTPMIDLLLGDRQNRDLARTASYVGGSGTNTLVFEYEVTAGDGRVGAVEVVAESLESNGATIRNERGYDAELYHLSAVQYAQRPSLSVADAEATEGEDATLDFVVRLDGNSGSDVTVDYRTRDGTAEAGSDYTETRGTLTFAPGEDEQTVSVPITDDDVEDDGETFTLVLSNVSGAGVANDDYEAVGTIRNSETPAAELTAEFRDMPETHDGESAFTFRVAFSEDIGISFRALREDASTVTGGRVTGGSRVDGRRDLFKMTVRPDSDGDVTITLPAGRECATSGAICTKGENRRQLTNSPSATVKGPAARYARLCSALGIGEEMTRTSTVAVLWEDGDVSDDRLAALDSLGNGNGGYDLGDMLAWAARCRGGEASGSAAGSGPPSPPPALPASRPAGGASWRRKRARGTGRHRRTVPDPPATGSATRRSGWLRTALLAAVISVWGCGDGIVDPRNDAPRYDGANAAVVDPGPLHVRLTAPAQARDIGAMLVIEGPAIDSLQAPGLEMFETEESSSTRREVIIAVALPDAPVLRVWVPHRGDEARYRVRLLQVAGEDFALRDLSVYGSVISR